MRDSKASTRLALNGSTSTLPPLFRVVRQRRQYKNAQLLSRSCVCFALLTSLFDRPAVGGAAAASGMPPPPSAVTPTSSNPPLQPALSGSLPAKKWNAADKAAEGDQRRATGPAVVAEGAATAAAAAAAAAGSRLWSSISSNVLGGLGVPPFPTQALASSKNTTQHSMTTRATPGQGSERDTRQTIHPATTHTVDGVMYRTIRHDTFASS